VYNEDENGTQSADRDSFHVRTMRRQQPEAMESGLECCHQHPSAAANDA